MFLNKFKLIIFIVLSVLLLSSCKQCPLLSAFKSSCGIKNTLQITDNLVYSEEKGVKTPKTVFGITEKIMLSFDVTKITAMHEKNTSIFWIRQDLVVKDLKEDIVLVKPGIIEIKKPVYEKPAKFVNEISFSNILNMKPGKYTISIIVTDLIGFNTDKKSFVITLK
jgi:hypothetical protein